MRIYVPHMTNAQEAVAFGIIWFGHAQTNAKGNASLMFAPTAQARAIGAAKAQSGHRKRSVRAFLHVQTQRTALPPCLAGSPDCAGELFMAGPNRFHPLCHHHVE